MNKNKILITMRCHSLGYQCFTEDVVLDCLNHREVKTTILRTSLSHGSMSVSANERNLRELWKEKEKCGPVFSGAAVRHTSKCRVGSGFQVYLEDHLHLG